MKKRDFLKFISCAGAALALGGIGFVDDVCAASENKSLSSYPRTRARLNALAPEIPESFARAVEKGYISLFKAVERVTDLTAADLLAMAFLETRIAEKDKLAENLFEIEDNTFVIYFRELTGEQIKTIAAKDKKLGAEVKRLVLAPEKEDSRKDILALRKKPLVAGMVAAHHVQVEAAKILKLVEGKGANASLLSDAGAPWVIHNLGRTHTQEIVLNPRKPISSIVPLGRLPSRGLKPQDTAREAFALMSGFYRGVREAFQDRLILAGLAEAPVVSATPSRPLAVAENTLKPAHGFLLYE